MNQVHQTTQPGIAEHAMLAGDIYKDRQDRGYSTNGWKATGKPIDNTDLTSGNGLQMQSYTNQQYANHVVIAIAGTNDRTDFDDNIAFVTGALEGQAKQALEHTAKLIDAANRTAKFGNTTPITFSTTGHSLGGGLAQLVAYTFNINGMALDAPGAQAIANNQAYGEYIEKLKQQYPDAFSNVAEPAVGENFVNINERGSVVPLFGQHLGQEMAINAVPNESPSEPWWGPLSRNIWWQTGKLVLQAGRYVVEQHQAAAQIDYLVQRYGPGRRPLTPAEIIAIRTHASLQEHAETKRVTQAGQHTITEAQQQANQTETTIAQQVKHAQAAAQAAQVALEQAHQSASQAYQSALEAAEHGVDAHFVKALKQRAQAAQATAETAQAQVNQAQAQILALQQKQQQLTDHAQQTAIAWTGATPTSATDRLNTLFQTRDRAQQTAQHHTTIRADLNTAVNTLATAQNQLQHADRATNMIRQMTDHVDDGIQAHQYATTAQAHYTAAQQQAMQASLIAQQAAATADALQQAAQAAAQQAQTAADLAASAGISARFIQDLRAKAQAAQTAAEQARNTATEAQQLAQQTSTQVTRLQQVVGAAATAAERTQQAITSATNHYTALGQAYQQADAAYTAYEQAQQSAATVATLKQQTDTQAAATQTAIEQTQTATADAHNAVAMANSSVGRWNHGGKKPVTYTDGNGTLHTAPSGYRYASDGTYLGWFGYTAPSPSPSPKPSSRSGGGSSRKTGKPVLIDMDGNGVNVNQLHQSVTSFDWNHDHYREASAWIAPGDALLVFDLDSEGNFNPDGQVTHAREIAFAQWTDAADTDLDALATLFDTQPDQVLDAADAQWHQFRVWQDLDRNGVVNAGEMQTLDAAGIVNIGLQRHADTQQELADGTVVYGLVDVQYRDGTRVNGAADVALAYHSVMDVTAANHERQRLQHSEQILAEYIKHTLLAADQATPTLSPATVAMRVHAQPSPAALGHWLVPSMLQPMTRIEGGRGDDHYWIKAGAGTVYIQDTAVETYIAQETRQASNWNLWEHLFKGTQFGTYEYTVAVEKTRQVSGGQDTLHVQGMTIDDLHVSRNAADDLVITTHTCSTRSGFQYAYYEGYWEQLPDFSTLTAVKSGYSEAIDLRHRTRDEGIGVVFDGQITITKGGQYTFFTTSDDGSKLYIDDQAVVDNDGLHGAQERHGTVTLSAGQHRVRVEFFEKGGGEVLQVHFQGPDTHHGKLALHTGHASIQTDDTTHIVIKDITRQDGELGNNLIDNSIPIETFQFQDGLKLNMGSIQDFNTGSNGDDHLIATKHATALLGQEGQDILTGSDYQDILIGGRGNDTLNGGKGDDIYVFSRSAQGGERDIVDEHYVTQEIRTRDVLQVVDRTWDPVWHDWFRHVDVWGWQTETYTIDVTKTDNIDNDTIKFDGSIAITDITRSRVGNDLILNITNPDSITGHDDQIIIVNDNIEYIELANGLTVSLDALRDDQTVGVYPFVQAHTDHYVQIGSDTDDDIIGHLNQTNIIWSGNGDDTVQVMAQDVVNTHQINGGAGVDHLILMDHTGVNLDVSVIDFEQVSAGDGDDVITGARHTRSGFHYQYYEGYWEQLPDFSTLAPVKSGYSKTVDLSHRIRDEGIGMVFTGQITIAQGGQYTFFTTSDDGSKLYIDDCAVVDNDGLHAVRERQGEMHLAAGQHTLRVEFFERCGGEVLQVHVQGPDTGGEKRLCIAPQVPIHTDLAMVYPDDVDYTFHGQGGDDVLRTGGGADRLYGGDGHDSLSSGAGDDVLCGGAGADQLHAGAGDDLLYVDHQDSVDGGAGCDTLVFTEDTNLIIDAATIAIEVVQSGSGDDDIRGSGDTSYTFDGGAGNDTLRGHMASDTLMGGEGNDCVFAGAGNDLLKGGMGHDDLWGEAGNDILQGGAGNDRLLGGLGVDELIGGTGDDSLNGDMGADTLVGGAGNDWLNGGAGADRLQGGTGDDTLYVDQADLNAGQIDGGSGRDTLVFMDDSVLTLNGSDLVRYAIEAVAAGAGGDVIVAEDVNEIDYAFNGGDGNDTLTGGSGDDILSGGAGADRLQGNAGGDILQGGAGDDTLYVDQADLDAGQIDGGSGIDQLVLMGEARFAQSVDNLAVEHVLAGAADDLIWGSRCDADYIFWAGTGADRLRSGGGNDWLVGESGDDVLQSQAGDDVLQGGPGYDLLDGGLGDDSYWFNRGDGYDILSDCGGVDQLRFGWGIDIADLVIRQDQADLLIYVRGVNLASAPLDKLTDCIRIQNWQSQNQRVERLGFSHGMQFELSHIQDTVATYDVDITVLYGGARNDVIQGNGMAQSLYGFGGDDIVLGSDQAELLYGGLGADTLHGGDGDDVITGAGGDDRLLASRGHDVYKFGRGDGRDLFEGSSAQGVTGTAVFDIDVDRQWLWFEQNGDDLVMRILHGDERITFRDWYSDGEEINSHVAAFSSRDKAVLLAGQVQQLVQAMASFDTVLESSEGIGLEHRRQDYLVSVNHRGVSDEAWSLG